MTEFGHFDILKLSELLTPTKADNSDGEDELRRPVVNAYDSTRFGDDDLEPTNHSVEEKKDDKKKIKEDEIVDPDEMAIKYLDAEDAQGSSDWRKTPEWDVRYRQQVSPSDVFLQMGGKTPATSSCEEMILSVHLPGESRQNVDLKITKEKLDLRSPNFRLDIPLPHPVDPQKGNAQFDSGTEKLNITLIMAREFDFVNF